MKSLAILTALMISISFANASELGSINTGYGIELQKFKDIGIPAGLPVHPSLLDSDLQTKLGISEPVKCKVCSDVGVPPWVVNPPKSALDSPWQVDINVMGKDTASAKTCTKHKVCVKVKGGIEACYEYEVCTGDNKAFFGDIEAMSIQPSWKNWK